MIVGLGGGIASGKTEASTYLQEQYQFNMIDTDVLAREVVMPGQKAYQEIVSHFGNGILLADGSLDRSKLRELIFSDVAEKTWLESVTHPAIRSLMQEKIKAAPKNAVTLLVSPLLYESEQYKLCYRNILIIAPVKIRTQRAVSRDSSSVDIVNSIINQQMPDEQKLEIADFIITNDSTITAFHHKLDAIAQTLLELAKS
ncbi:dephospho-CoA kinase [Gynuella sunshinyii]|uniref:Dephospho-CoA kinase n=1 Tax=Gynuella sunshinyii YC6258 TaxID=1445510 RepID=A0A0C5VJH4_9GAMM|nr:dephospho-CoA kinase [Gynuella sunshinyii]AJQ94441.1 dephospho-CoA kinase [Gynuella sunshinyii YC6258]